MPSLSNFAVDDDGWLLFNNRRIANFVPRIVEQFWYPDCKNSLPDVIQVEFSLAGESVLHRVFIVTQEIDSFKFEEHFPACICTDENVRSTRPKIRLFLRLQLGKTPDSCIRHYFYPSTGWYFAENSPRFVAGQQLIPSNEAEVFHIAADVEKYRLVSLPKPSSPDNVISLLTAMQGMTAAIPVFGFTLLASLKSIFHTNKLPTSCILYIQGSQGFGKTELAKRFSLLYDQDICGGRSIADHYDAESTAAAMRNALAGARDRVVLLDDICCSSAPVNQRARYTLAAELIRAAANEIPLTRMRGRIQESVFCSASLVITGEIGLTAASDLTRCILVDLEQPLRSDDPNIRSVAAATLESYLEWFSLHGEDEQCRLRKDYDAFKNCDRQHHEERLQVSLWELSWVYDSFLRFATDIQAVSKQAANEFEATVTKILQEIYGKTLSRIHSRPEATEASLIPIITRGVNFGQIPYITHRGCLCIRSQDLAEYLNYTYSRYDYTDRDVANLLRQQGLLRMDKSGTATRKIEGIRYLTIPLDKVPGLKSGKAHT